MEGHCSTSQSPQWAVVLMEEEKVLVSLHFEILNDLNQSIS